MFNRFSFLWWSISMGLSAVLSVAAVPTLAAGQSMVSQNTHSTLLAQNEEQDEGMPPESEKKRQGEGEENKGMEEEQKGLEEEQKGIEQEQEGIEKEQKGLEEEEKGKNEEEQGQQEEQKKNPDE